MKTHYFKRTAWIALQAFLVVGSLLGTRLANAADDKQSTQMKVADIVGEYYRSARFWGCQLTLHSDYTFTYEESDDTDLDVKRSGTFQLEHNVLTLHPATVIGKTASASKEFTPGRTEDKLADNWLVQALYYIVWGKRAYLLTAQEIPFFCNYVNLGREPRGTTEGDYLVRASPTRLYRLPRVRPLPLLPAPWNELLLPKPVVAKVLAVMPTGRKEKQDENASAGDIIALTLDKGARAGLKPGMMFSLTRYFDDNMAIVREVQPEQCVAEIVIYEHNIEIKIGAHVSTRLSKTAVLHYQHWPKRGLISVK